MPDTLHSSKNNLLFPVAVALPVNVSVGRQVFGDAGTFTIQLTVRDVGTPGWLYVSALSKL